MLTSRPVTAVDFWKKRRKVYLWIAIVSFTVAAGFLINPRDPAVEASLLTPVIILPGMALVVFLMNQCYKLGPYCDRRFNKQNRFGISNSLFISGIVFSAVLPWMFLIWK